MAKVKEFVIRHELAELSGVHEYTIRKYTDFKLLESTDTRPRKYKTGECLERIKEIQEKLDNGYSYEMMKEYFNKK